MKGTESSDIVDKAFNLGYFWYDKANRLVSNFSENAVKKVNSIKNNIKIYSIESNNVIKHSILNDNSTRTFGVGKIYKTFYTSGIGKQISKNWILSAGVTTTAVFLGFKLLQALRISKTISRNETQMILILGDYSDPIIRSQALDFYRRNYTVYICSETADRFKLQQEDFENLYFINPNSEDDLYKFTKLFDSHSINNTNCYNNKLVSIIFTPKLSYFTPGEVSLETLQYEIKANILINYNTLLKIIPHLPRSQVTQLILLNPSLSYNLQNTHHPTEMFISAFITAIYKSLKNYDSLSVFMIHIGLFQVRGQLSNYKYLKWNGSDIGKYLHDPLYELIRRYNGNLLQSLCQRIWTINGYWPVYYMGKYSLLATFNIFPLFMKFEAIYCKISNLVIHYFNKIIFKLF
ncbi:Ysc83p PWA37_004173 [Arxiozyma heterogenica]|uniref:Ysc83p n=1 Tax=Arxiozyma heterogenica TaxID=278026 RepID=UPI002F0D5C2A